MSHTTETNRYDYIADHNIAVRFLEQEANGLHESMTVHALIREEIYNKLAGLSYEQKLLKLDNIERFRRDNSDAFNYGLYLSCISKIFDKLAEEHSEAQQ